MTRFSCTPSLTVRQQRNNYTPVHKLVWSSMTCSQMHIWSLHLPFQCVLSVEVAESRSRWIHVLCNQAFHNAISEWSRLRRHVRDVGWTTSEELVPELHRWTSSMGGAVTVSMWWSPCYSISPMPRFIAVCKNLFFVFLLTNFIVDVNRWRSTLTSNEEAISMPTGSSTFRAFLLFLFSSS